MTQYETLLISTLKRFDRLLHLLLATALVVGCVMVVWEFLVNISHALQQGHLAGAFLSSLGTLFLVWTLSSLVSAEIRYLKNGMVRVQIFIEVAMITLLRQLIVGPLQIVTTDQPAADTPGLWHYGLLLLALLVTGIVHRLVGEATFTAAAGHSDGKATPAD
ncbi:MAG: phosphate-starvation-inducible PsiE family protein [Gallionellaceae bacterium]|nr:phosphate-starvation-inducible PsiE family protein [Gallionellaceae bacterium]